MEGFLVHVPGIIYTNQIRIRRLTMKDVLDYKLVSSFVSQPQSLDGCWEALDYKLQHLGPANNLRATWRVELSHLLRNWISWQGYGKTPFFPGAPLGWEISSPSLDCLSILESRCLVRARGGGLVGGSVT